jgi:hypothetical protein
MNEISLLSIGNTIVDQNKLTKLKIIKIIVFSTVNTIVEHNKYIDLDEISESTLFRIMNSIVDLERCIK